jgi:anti-sigma regulatory factor (Ser/Thr protein kinase)
VPEISCSFPPTLASTRDARLAASDVALAGGLDASARDTLLLLLSELVTNAVCHAATRYELIVAIGEETVHIEVTDADPSEPRRRVAAPDHEGGHGLNLVERLADRWGTRARLDGVPGKTVWADIDLGRAPTAPPSPRPAPR